MTTEQKLAACVKALMLMCKPTELCTEEELEFLHKFPCGEDQLAYETLVKIGIQPIWEGPQPIRIEDIGPGPHYFELDLDEKPTLRLIK